MEFKLLVCGVMLVVLVVTGSNAQLEVCGTAPLNTRIVGGEDAPAGSWPWMASLHRNGKHECGGSLINNQWILTAAHCFPSTSTSGLKVYLGRDTQKLPNPNEVSQTVSKIVKHPNYDPKEFGNDVALLQLSSPVTFTNYIRPVCLAAEDSVFDSGITCWVTGWGDTQSGVSLPAPGTLQQVNVPIVSNEDCNAAYGLITSNMICAGQGGKDSCNGDSGGPLVRKTGSKWVQAGVVISGKPCALPNFPTIYARVSEFQSWINSEITTNQPGFVFSGTAHLVSLSLPLLLSIVYVPSLFVLS